MSDTTKTPYTTKAYRTFGAGAGQVVFWVVAVIAVLGFVAFVLHQTGVLPAVNRFQ